MAREVPREVIVKPPELAKLYPRLAGQGSDFRKDLSTEVGTALLLICFTGCRSSEASGARWQELDLDTGWWSIPSERFKSDRVHKVFLHPEIQQRIDALPRVSDLVFPSPRTGKRLGEKTLHQALKRSNAGTYHLHDIRRSVATAMGESGVMPHVIERVLGHTRPGLQKVYNHSGLDQQARDAWLLWGDTLMEEVGNAQ
jgi:integrase